MLFNLDEREVAELFKEWNNKFEVNWLEMRAKGEKGMFIHSLYHFFLYVEPHLDRDGKQFFQDANNAIIYKNL